MVEDFATWAGIEPAPAALESLRADWTLHPYTVDGEVRAIAAMSGSEIHFAIAPRWRHRVIARQRTRCFLDPLLAVHGFLTTRSERGSRHHQFLSRIGFELTWFDGKLHHYMMTALPFGRN